MFPSISLQFYIICVLYTKMSLIYLTYFIVLIKIQQRMISRAIFNPSYLFAKFYKSSKEAIQGISDNSFLLVGGFGICGIPMNLINAVRESQVKNLTIASNNCGYAVKQTSQKDWGLAVLLRNKQIKRMISSYVGQNPEFEKQYFEGDLELQICPQGTLAEKIRSGGAGIPAFYTATGVGTIIQNGGFPIKYKPGTKEVQIQSQRRQSQVFNNKKYILEPTIFAQYALVKAYKADTLGNLMFNKTSRNFNADMCMAAKCVIAQVQEVVQPGEISPEDVHIPSVFVDRIFKSDPKNPYSEKRIEKKTVQTKQQSAPKKGLQTRLKIIKRAAKQVDNGMNVNLGIGIPTLLPSVLPEDIKINLQSQNGIFGVGPYPTEDNVDPDLINAGKETITTLPGGSYFSSSQSFGIIRGGHLDLTMLGALQVSQDCDIANWIIPNKLVKGMGGAMDLVACGSKVIVVMQHTAKNSQKILQKCTLPLTAQKVVSMVITELAVFENQNGKLVLIEIAEGTTFEEVQEKTGFKITRAAQLKKF